MVQPKYNPQEALERVKLMMNYDLSKTSTENKKVVSEQTTSPENALACVKKNYELKADNGIYYPTQSLSDNYFRLHLIPFEKTKPGESVTVWNFDSTKGANRWTQMENGTVMERGTFSCIDDSNFRITKEDGSFKYKSGKGSNIKLDGWKQKIESPSFKLIGLPYEQKPTQSVEQPAKTEPKVDKQQDTSISSEPEKSKPEKVKKQPDSVQSNSEKLKPKDSPLGTTLKDTSIPKRSCVVYVDQLFEAWERSRGQKFDTNQINELRGYVQRCMDDHFPSGSKQGNWGITGLGGGKTDQKLLQLSACKAPAPSQSGPDSIFRLARKC